MTKPTSLGALTIVSTPESEPQQTSSMARDLLPIAVVLWLGSVARVALTVLHGDVFDAEATLALACIFVIPALALREHQRETRGRALAPAPDDAPPNGRGRLIELEARRRATRKGDRT